MYSFRFQGSCCPINNDVDAVIVSNQQDQRLLESLRIIRLALKCKDVDELEDFDFGRIPFVANDQERCLLRSIQHTL
ncbi:hypothetical protein G6F56_002629 [Rhizopus delemar]|nr:hypothetical protein G6F56_002629 [Rhizopus delemar]